MLDTTGDWCFEGGCSYLTDSGITADMTMMNEIDCDERELEALYNEPCIWSFD